MDLEAFAQVRLPQAGLSALIVTYQHEAFIQEAIRSALLQSQPPDQVVVVDDGSTDRTVELARAMSDPRVEVLTIRHRGLAELADVYNAGLDRCRGGLIAILEGDDRWPSRKLETQIPAFNDPRVVLSHGRYGVISVDGDLRHPGVDPPVDLPHGPYDPRRYILQASYIMMVTVVLRREALLSVGGFRQLQGTSHCDYSTFLALAESGHFDFRPERVGEWRRHRSAGTYLLNEATGAGTAMQLALSARARWHGPGLPSVAQIEASWADADARRAWQAARVLLTERRRADAWRVVHSALRRPASWPLRVRLLLAGLAAVVGGDVEWLAGWARRRVP